MKKILAFVFVAVLMFTLALPAMAAVQIDAPKGTPVVDGVKDDCYGAGVDVKAWREGTNKESGAWGTVYAAWDENFIYYYMEVIDTTPNHSHDSNDYQTDNVEFFLDWFNAKEEDSADGSPYHQIRIHSGNGAGDQGYDVTGAANKQWGDMSFIENLKHVVLPLNGSMNNGYIIELAISVKDVEGGIKLVEGMNIAIDFQVADNQEGEGRDSQAFIMASDTNDSQWTNPSTCNGLLVLGAAKPAPAPEPEPEPEPAVGGGDENVHVVDTPAPAPAPAPVVPSPVSPDTGDSVVLLGAIMVLAAASIVIIRKKISVK